MDDHPDWAAVDTASKKGSAPAATKASLGNEDDLSLEIECTAEEAEQLRVLAAKAGLSVQDFILRAASEELVVVWKERALLAERQAEETRAQALHARTDAEVLRREGDGIEKQLAEIQRQLKGSKRRGVL